MRARGEAACGRLRHAFARDRPGGVGLTATEVFRLLDQDLFKKLAQVSKYGLY